ncbi:unnamed protein product [Peniophora sp. CBMAI 1063]|nr:unnamed protein product [Peniophora sp. CBMAI 1063]
MSRSDRQDLARAAAQHLQIQSAESQLSTEKNALTTIAGVALVLADNDRLNNGTAYETVVGDVLSDHDRSLAYNIDFAFFGLAELAASRAYNDSDRRNTAIANWNTIFKNSYISPAVAQSNVFPRNLTTDPACGMTLGGMVFEYDDQTNRAVWTRMMTPWIMLSAQLANITGDMTYLQPAETSIQFIQKYLLDLTVASPDFVAHTFDATSCEPSYGSSTTLDIAPLIEGLSIAANLTGNQNYTQLLAELISRAVLGWSNQEGVMTEGSVDLGKGYMVHALLEARRSNTANDTLNSLIDTFLTIQFNAVWNNASLGNNNYNVSWIGDSGPSSSFDRMGSIEALHTLNAATAIAPAPPDQEPVAHPSINVRAIIGAVVGGVAGIAMCAIGLLICLRRKRSGGSAYANGAMELTAPPRGQPGVLEPYVLTVSDIRHSATTKGNPYSRVTDSSAANGNETAGGSMSDGPTEPPRQAADGLARRLENLIDALATRRNGAVEESPPLYEPRTTGTTAGQVRPGP